MKENRIFIVKELLVTQMNHWPLFTLPVTVMIMWDAKAPVMWVWGLCSFLPFLLYFVRRNTEGFFRFIAAHILCGLAFWYLPCADTLQQVMLRIMIVGYLLRSCWLRIRTADQKEKGMYPAFAVGIIAVSFMIAGHSGLSKKNGTWDIYYIMAAVAALGLFFIKFYLEHYLYFLVVNDSSAGYLPAGEIFRSGVKMALLYTAAGVAVLFLTSGMEWLAGLMGKLGNWLLLLLKRLLRGINDEPAEEEILPQTELEAAPPPVLEAAEPSRILVILQQIFLLAVVFIILTAVVLGILFLIHYLLVRFRNKAQTDELVLEEVSDVREKFQEEKPDRRKRSSFDFLKPRERIRRIFKKRVLNGKNEIMKKRKGKFLQYLTARECTDSLEQELLGNLYEKARYSEEECTIQDVRALREET